MGRVLSALLVACASSAPHGTSIPPSTDDAVELAALLPEHADHCVVVRPGALAERRRSLVVLMSVAEEWAWDRRLPIVAYASAQVETGGGRRARRSYVRFSEALAPEDPRFRMLGVRMLDEPCEGDECRRPAARWIDARTLEIARHEWTPSAAPTPSGGCIALARRFPTAIELAVETRATFGGVYLPEPRSAIRVVSARRTALVSRRELAVDDIVQARMLAMRLQRRRPSDDALVPVSSSERAISIDGARVVLEEAHLWEEIELAREDERLRQHAERLSRERALPPIDRVRIEDAEVVRRQVALRRAQLANVAPADRERAAAELADLLRRARAAHPADPSFALALAELELDVRGDPRAAVAIFDEVSAAGDLGDPEAWHLLRRRALSRIGAPELAAALISDGIAERAEASSAAADLLALVLAGVPYEWAEGAWRTSRELAHGSTRRIPEVLVPFEGVIGALVAHARLSGSGAHSMVQIAVRTRDRGEARAIGESRPDIVAVRAGSGMVYVAALPSPDLVELRRIGALLAGASGSGELEIAIALRAPNAGDARVLRVAGTRAGDTLAIARTSADIDPAVWPSLARYVALPLAEMPTALFPPPSLTVRAESAEAASALWRGVEESFPGACSTAGPVLRCESAVSMGPLILRIAELARPIGD